MHGDDMTTPDIYADYIKSLTLLFALVGVITAAENFSLPVKAHGYLGAAIILFAVAVAIGIGANLPFVYREAYPTPAQLAKVWHYTEPQAQAHIIATHLRVLGSARRANGIKGLLVLIAGIVQLAALIMLVVAVLMIVSTKS
jgi:hypothetical protein